MDTKFFFFFQAEDGIRDLTVTGVQTCALPISMFSEISARAQENFSGARVIRAYVQEEPEIAAFETSNREYIHRSLKLVRLMGMLWPTLETMLGLAIVL